jgi:hypothetical protein
MDKDRRSQPHNQPVESQLPVRWKVQVEDEPAAGRSPAEAVLSEEHHGPLTPFQADHGLPSEPLNCKGKLRGLPASCPIASRVSQVLTLFLICGAPCAGCGAS